MDEIKLAEQKKELRREKKALRRDMDPAVRHVADAAINTCVIDFLQHTDFDSVVSYATDGTEPDLTKTMQWVLDQGKLLFLPRFLAKDKYDIVKVNSMELPASKWGIPEPASDAPLARREQLANALWLVPGVAFDRFGHRLGRGGGIYDRLMTEYSGKFIGIYYEVQRCEGIPCGIHDRGTDYVTTEQGIFEVTNA